MSEGKLVGSPTEIVNAKTYKDGDKLFWQQGPRHFIADKSTGDIYLLLSKSIRRVDPQTDGSVQLVKLADIPDEISTGITAGGDILNDRLYFAGGSHIYSYDLGKEKDEGPVIGDDTPPTINSINLVDGQTIKTNPYIIIANVTDDVAVSRVDFYVDDTLIGSNTMPDNDHNYEIPWDTSKYHSEIRAVAIDSSGNTASAEKNTTVNLDTSLEAPPLIILPKTGSGR